MAKEKEIVMLLPKTLKALQPSFDRQYFKMVEILWSLQQREKRKNNLEV